jgi:molybdopterin synthase catalytic subunit
MAVAGLALHDMIKAVDPAAVLDGVRAIAVCAELVEEIKRRLPVWKHQVFADGTEEWVNCP